MWLVMYSIEFSLALPLIITFHPCGLSIMKESVGRLFRIMHGQVHPSQYHFIMTTEREDSGSICTLQ